MRRGGVPVRLGQPAHDLVGGFRVLFGDHADQRQEAVFGRSVSALDQALVAAARRAQVAVAKLQPREIEQRLVAVLVELVPALGALQSVFVEAVARRDPGRLSSDIDALALLRRLPVFARRLAVVLPMQRELGLQHMRTGVVRLAVVGRQRDVCKAQHDQGWRGQGDRQPS